MVRSKGIGERTDADGASGGRRPSLPPCFMQCQANWLWRYQRKRMAKGSHNMRGCEKRVVVLRHADSALFEEAYFVMRKASGRASHTDMVAEAERLLTGGETSLATEQKREKEPKKKKDGRARRAFLSFLWFCLGGACAAAAFLL